MALLGAGALALFVFIFYTVADTTYPREGCFVVLKVFGISIAIFTVILAVLLLLFIGGFALLMQLEGCC